MSKTTQGFSLRCTSSTPQTETRGERRSWGKGPFMDGNQSTHSSNSLNPLQDRRVAVAKEYFEWMGCQI